MEPASQPAVKKCSSDWQQGEPGIPTSFRIGGALRFVVFHSFHLYGSLLKAIQYRPVALGASSTIHQPLRYIYLPNPGQGKLRILPALSDGKRRFVEVDFEFQKDNSFWVYIRGTREVDRNVRVSETMF